jgi:hypothetical protein
MFKFFTGHNVQKLNIAGVPRHGIVVGGNCPHAKCRGNLASLMEVTLKNESKCMRRTVRVLGLATVVVLSVPAGAVAADARGDFAVKGSGFETCSMYLSSKEEGGPLYLIFRAWMNGYLTGHNANARDTYDISPIYDVDVLAEIIANLCKSKPEARFVGAIASLVQELDKTKLAEKSPPVTMSNNGAEVTLPKEVLRWVQTRLKEKGYYTGGVDGLYGAGTRRALERFQASADLAKSGLPDDLTLLRLFQ